MADLPLSDLPIRQAARRISDAPWCFSASEISRVILALLGEEVPDRTYPQCPPPP